MRIDAYNQIAQIYGATRSNNTQAVKKTGSMGRDEVQISSAGRDIGTAKSAVAAASDIRTDKVNDIKAQIKNGTYSVSTEDFASKLMEKYNSLF